MLSSRSVSLDYLNDAKLDEFLNDFYVQLPIHGYDLSISKKVSFNKTKKIVFNLTFSEYLQPYLKDLMNELRNFIFSNATTTFDRADRRIMMNSDFKFVYFIEKWVQKHVAISRKDTFYHEYFIIEKTMKMFTIN